jgi:signal transduction histidine kinase
LGNFVSDRIGPLRESLYFYSQGPLLVSMLIVAATSVGSGSSTVYSGIWSVGLITLLISLGGMLLPWHRISARWMIVIAITDILAITQLRADNFSSQPGSAILVLIPTLWLAYTFGIVGVILAVLGDYLVALYPYLSMGYWPGSPSAWGNATLLPAIVSAVGIAVYVAARQIEKQRLQLTEAYERLRAADDLRRDTESTAIAVINSVNAGITFYDASGTILLTNDSARSLAALGNRATAKTVSHSSVVFEEDRVTPIPVSDQVVARAERGEMETGRTIWVGTGARQRAVMVTSQLVHRDSGELIGTLIATQDVTDLTNAISSRDDFLRTVSHELRTPLTSMIGYLEIIEDAVDLEAAGIAAEFAIVQRNSQRLLTLINALIIEAEGRVSLRRRPENISALVRDVLMTVGPAAAAAGVTIDASLDDTAVAEVDRTHMTQVVDTLLSNALKFNRRDGAVFVSVAEEGDEIVIRVADTGIGIPDSEQSKVFDPFYRGSAAQEGVIAGAGLGLSSARLIVESHSGTIELDPTATRGTTMTVRLPRAPRPILAPVDTVLRG